MRAYSATVGATDGNIIAAIITTQTPRNQPSAPSAVPGPSSIPAMRSAVDHHATAASANSSAIRPRRARAAAKRRRQAASARSAVALTQAAQAKRDVENPDLPSYSTPNALMLERVALAIVSSEPAGMEDAGQPRRLARLRRRTARRPRSRSRPRRRS